LVVFGCKGFLLREWVCDISNSHLAQFDPASKGGGPNFTVSR
jgi:hypothetical protein